VAALVYHLVPEEELGAGPAPYVPRGFEREGFIHTTRPLERIAEVGNRYYRGDPRPYLLLTVDLDRIGVPWRYDAAGEDFPHLYGPLDRRAIVGVRRAPRAEDGAFLPVGPEV
jgi:uncharacterized protein (DUF952 family)